MAVSRPAAEPACLGATPARTAEVSGGQRRNHQTHPGAVDQESGEEQDDIARQADMHDDRSQQSLARRQPKRTSPDFTTSYAPTRVTSRNPRPSFPAPAISSSHSASVAATKN